MHKPYLHVLMPDFYVQTRSSIVRHVSIYAHFLALLYSFSHSPFSISLFTFLFSMVVVSMLRAPDHAVVCQSRSTAKLAAIG